MRKCKKFICIAIIALAFVGCRKKEQAVDLLDTSNQEKAENEILSNDNCEKNQLSCVSNLMTYEQETRIYNEKEQELIKGQTIRIENGESLYLTELNCDNGAGRKNIQIKKAGYESYSFSVGGCQYQNCISLTGDIYATTFQSEYVFLLVQEDNGCGYQGVSVFRFDQSSEAEQLIFMGTLDGSYVDIIHNTLVLHGKDTTLYPHEFYRDFTYVLCIGTFNLNGTDGNENIVSCKLVQSPEECAPIGNVLYLKRDIELYDRYSSSKRCRLVSGSYINICATDGDGWIYVEEADTSLNGWFHIERKNNQQYINGEAVTVKEYFDGLIVGD